MYDSCAAMDGGLEGWTDEWMAGLDGIDRWMDEWMDARQGNPVRTPARATLAGAMDDACMMWDGQPRTRNLA